MNGSSYPWHKPTLETRGQSWKKRFIGLSKNKQTYSMSFIHYTKPLGILYSLTTPSLQSLPILYSLTTTSCSSSSRVHSDLISAYQSFRHSPISGSVLDQSICNTEYFPSCCERVTWWNSSQTKLGSWTSAVVCSDLKKNNKNNCEASFITRVQVYWFHTSTFWFLQK